MYLGRRLKINIALKIQRKKRNYHIFIRTEEYLVHKYESGTYGVTEDHTIPIS